MSSLQIKQNCGLSLQPQGEPSLCFIYTQPSVEGPGLRALGRVPLPSPPSKLPQHAGGGLSLDLVHPHCVLSHSHYLCLSLFFFFICTHVNSVNGIEVSPTVNQICSWLFCCNLQDLENENLPAGSRYVFNNS